VSHMSRTITILKGTALVLKRLAGERLCSWSKSRSSESSH
jgi:hypothetical protein